VHSAIGVLNTILMIETVWLPSLKHLFNARPIARMDGIAPVIGVSQ